MVREEGDARLRMGGEEEDEEPLQEEGPRRRRQKEKGEGRLPRRVLRLVRFHIDYSRSASCASSAKKDPSANAMVTTRGAVTMASEQAPFSQSAGRSAPRDVRKDA